VLRITVALPLSAGRMVRLVFSFKLFSAALSALVRLSLGIGEFFIILTVSCLASSAVSTGSDLTAFSTPVRMSSIGVYRGVTAKFRHFCSSEAAPSSNFWSLRLMTVSVVVFVVGRCVL